MPKVRSSEFIFGIRSVLETIYAGKDIEKVFLKKGLQGELFKELLTTLEKTSIPFQWVPLEKLNKLTGKNHQGVIALISPVTYSNIEEIIPRLFEEGKFPLVLLLDGVTDVRNFGAIARTAECAGVHALIIPEKGSAQINADAVKTSAGALQKIPVCRSSNLTATLKFLQNSGLQVIAASEKGDEYYFQADLTVPTVLIMGAEDKGISSGLIQLSGKKVKIPVNGTITSLNVSVAAGILIYEAIRQRNF